MIALMRADGGRSTDGHLALIPVPGWVFKAVAALLLAWISGYLTGAFPYLGNFDHMKWDGPAVVSNESNLGSFNLPYVWIGRGQAIFIDYDVRLEGNGFASVSLQRRNGAFGGHWQSASELVKSSDSGRLVYAVPQSGFYRVRMASFGSLSPHSIKITGSWGATFPWGLRGMPDGEAPARTMPQSRELNPEDRLLPSL